MRKHITILGSTGSIGTQCADVAIKTGVCVDYIAFGTNVKLAAEQINTLKPKYCCCADAFTAKELKKLVSDSDCEIFWGREKALELISKCASDVIFNAVSGKNGFDFTVSAIKTGKRIGLANKESMVIAGDYVKKLAHEYNAQIIPVDSEHSAIFQCLAASSCKPKRILLTASGGPFFGMKREEIASKKAVDALKHPNWDMGKKILIDSATLANKGLEFIEAMKLFDVSAEQVKVIIQRQSIIHSMVQFEDNSVLAQLGTPDMRLPIEYAITYPERGISVCNELDWDKIDNINIASPDLDAFPMLSLAIECAKYGGSAPCVYNAANEVAVELYLCNKIGFYDIYEICKETVEHFKNGRADTPEEIESTDKFAREYASAVANRYITQ